MAATFFFYDLETTGIGASACRIMQFAGIRTDENLVPIGDPVNVFIKLSADVVPSPDAIMITGITPQQTLIDGITEAEFLKYFYDEVVQPDTTFLGFNTIRFDDEFMRCLHYRNFYDPYEWQWFNGCSKWDILDLVRMTRALRPDGIEWPFTDDGKPTNRLELLTKLNGLEHEHAHDALSDVYATIAVAKMIRDKQPELFKYLYDIRGKKKAAELVMKGEPFVYSTGKYPSETLSTSAAVLLARHPQQDHALVFDLRFDPTPFATMTPKELTDAWRYNKTPGVEKLPVKTLKYNRCPAIAPLGVMADQATQDRLKLDVATVQRHYATLQAVRPQLAQNVYVALQTLDDERAAERAQQVTDVDGQLYDAFVGDADKKIMRSVQQAPPEALGDFAVKFSDKRLKELLPLYKARNFPASLTSEERAAWDEHCADRLLSGGDKSELAQFFARLAEIGAETDLSDEKKFLLEELQLYGQSIVPSDVAE